jgi:hypothetical protein
MDRHAATRRLRHLAGHAGIRLPRMHPHMLRHTSVTTMLDAGVDLRDVQIAARHADPRTTMQYDRPQEPRAPELHTCRLHGVRDLTASVDGGRDGLRIGEGAPVELAGRRVLSRARRLRLPEVGQEGRKERVQGRRGSATVRPTVERQGERLAPLVDQRQSEVGRVVQIIPEYRPAGV